MEVVVVIESSFELRLPEWVDAELSSPRSFSGLEDRMAFAIHLSERNAREGTGGPFGAAVFDMNDGTLLGVGVNVVVESGYSLAHAEMVALSLAQRARGNFDLAAAGRIELISSAEPCAMCLGAICWSGVGHVACAARGSDVEKIGFDEGPKPPNWSATLRSRRIDVTLDVLRDEAVQVLNSYQTDGGAIYNAGAME
jgi:tRNA(Arg) A34 adenosine deaminase TadA